MSYQTKDEGAQPFVSPIIQPEPLRYSHLWKAAKTYEDAFKFGPFIMYMKADAKPSRVATRAQTMAAFALWTIKDIFLTVNGGSALILAYLNFSGDKTAFERFIDTLSFKITDADKKTEEQKKRLQEGHAKSKAVIDATIRDRLPDMIFVGLVATAPASQGKGYGGVLLEAMNDIADERGKAMWLTSSNVLNDAFYNSHGFMTVGTYYMGEGNPTWMEKPVPIQVMVREPKQKSENVEPKVLNRAMHMDPMFTLRSLI